MLHHELHQMPSDFRKLRQLPETVYQNFSWGIKNGNPLSEPLFKRDRVKDGNFSLPIINKSAHLYIYINCLIDSSRAHYDFQSSLKSVPEQTSYPHQSFIGAQHQGLQSLLLKSIYLKQYIMDFKCTSLVLDQMVIAHLKSPLFWHEWADKGVLTI